MKSLEMTAKEAVSEILGMESENEIQNFIEGDDRSTVTKEAEKRIEKLRASKRRIRSVPVSVLGNSYTGILSVTKGGLYQLNIQKIDAKPMKVKKTETVRRKRKALKIGISPEDYSGKAYSRNELEKHRKSVQAFLEDNEMTTDDATVLVKAKNIKAKDDEGNAIKEVPLIDETLQIKTILFLEDEYVLHEIPYYTEGRNVKIEDFGVLDVYHNMKNRAIRQAVISYVKLNSK